MAFWPLGNRGRIEQDIICFQEVGYHFTYQDIMSMPVSRRHRLLKLREWVVDLKNQEQGRIVSSKQKPTSLGEMFEKSKGII